MLEGGADVRYVQEMLGHSCLQASAVYTHVSILQPQRLYAATHPAAFVERRAHSVDDDDTDEPIAAADDTSGPVESRDDGSDVSVASSTLPAPLSPHRFLELTPRRSRIRLSSSANSLCPSRPDICTAVPAENVVQRYATAAEISTHGKSSPGQYVAEVRTQRHVTTQALYGSSSSVAASPARSLGCNICTFDVTRHRVRIPSEFRPNSETVSILRALCRHA